MQVVMDEHDGVVGAFIGIDCYPVVGGVDPGDYILNYLLRVIVSAVPPAGVVELFISRTIVTYYHSVSPGIVSLTRPFLLPWRRRLVPRASPDL